MLPRITLGFYVDSREQACNQMDMIRHDYEIANLISLVIKVKKGFGDYSGDGRPLQKACPMAIVEAFHKPCRELLMKFPL